MGGLVVTGQKAVLVAVAVTLNKADGKTKSFVTEFCNGSGGLLPDSGITLMPTLQKVL